MAPSRAAGVPIAARCYVGFDTPASLAALPRAARDCGTDFIATRAGRCSVEPAPFFVDDLAVHP